MCYKCKKGNKKMFKQSDAAYKMKVCLYCMLAVFSLCTPKLQAFPAMQPQVGLNEIAFAFKVEKLVEKVNKYKDRQDQKKLLDTMMEIKIEVEGYTGKKIHLDKELDKIEHEMKKRGGNLKKEEFQKLRKIIKQNEKRSNHKTLYMAECITYGMAYDGELEQFDYMTKQGHEKPAEEIDLPARFTIGITVALCGSFLSYVPLPICQLCGPALIEGGLLLAA